MIDFKKFRHLGFIRLVPKKTRRLQISEEFLKFVTAYEISGNRHQAVRGVDLLAVMAVLRSKPPSHCWKGKTLILEMKKIGMGECKTKAVLSCLNQAGWIRYLKVLIKGTPIGSVTEVMYWQLPKKEAGRDRQIRLGPNGEPQIFRREEMTWVRVPDDDYPSKYQCAEKSGAAQMPAEGGAEPEVWVPLVWKSSERGAGGRNPSDRPSDGREASEEYREDEIQEDNIEENRIEIPPISPLSEKGDRGFASPGEEESGGSDADTFPEAKSVIDEGGATLGVAPDPSWFVSELVNLGRQSLNSLPDRLKYEEFVVDQLLPQLLPERTPQLPRWSADTGIRWLETALVAQVILALFSDRCWPQDVGRAFQKRSRNLSEVDLKKILLGFDWARHGSESVTSLFGIGSGKSRSEGWEKFVKLNQERYNDERRLLSFSIGNLDLEPNDWHNFSDWIERQGRHPNAPLCLGFHPREKFEWLYYTAFLKKRDLEEGSPEIRQEFEKKREEWRSEVTEFVAKSRIELAVVLCLRPQAQSIWGLDVDEIRNCHDAWMQKLRVRARHYELKVERTFTHLFEVDFEKLASEHSGSVCLPPFNPEPKESAGSMPSFEATSAFETRNGATTLLPSMRPSVINNPAVESSSSLTNGPWTSLSEPASAPFAPGATVPGSSFGGGPQASPFPPPLDAGTLTEPQGFIGLGEGPPDDGGTAGSVRATLPRMSGD